MNNDDKPESIAIVPSIPRYIIGIIVGIVSLILGGFLIKDPTWLRAIIFVLGVIQLIISAVHTRQVLRHYRSK